MHSQSVPRKLCESGMLELSMTVMFLAVWLFVAYEVVARHAADAQRTR
jgi:hypothetical protein